MPVHRRAVALGVLLCAAVTAFLVAAAASGLRPGDLFPLSVLALVVGVLLLRFALRLAGAVRGLARRGRA